MQHGAPSIAVVASRVRIFIAWIMCGVAVAAGTAGAFRGVDGWARAAFEDHRRESVPGVSGTGEVVGSVTISDDIVVRYEFDADRDGLMGLRVRTVTWGAVPDAYECTWSLLEISADGKPLRTVGSGSFATATATDWGYRDLRFDPIPDSFTMRFALRITTGSGSPAKPLGLPLFRTAEDAVNCSVRRRRGQRPAIPWPATLDVRPIHVGEGA